MPLILFEIWPKSENTNLLKAKNHEICDYEIESLIQTFLTLLYQDLLFFGGGLEGVRGGVIKSKFGPKLDKLDGGAPTNNHCT